MYHIIFQDKYAEASVDSAKRTLKLVSKSSFIPAVEFQRIFGLLAEIVPKASIDKFIFDKRSLTVFHQASMAWYHVFWKKDMLKYGLKKHVKLLPDDIIFRKSVEIGRHKIMQENPDHILGQLTILYVESMEEAETV